MLCLLLISWSSEIGHHPLSKTKTKPPGVLQEPRGTENNHNAHRRAPAVGSTTHAMVRLRQAQWSSTGRLMCLLSFARTSHGRSRGTNGRQSRIISAQYQEEPETEGDKRPEITLAQDRFYVRIDNPSELLGDQTIQNVRSSIREDRLTAHPALVKCAATAVEILCALKKFTTSKFTNLRDHERLRNLNCLLH